MGIFYEEGLNEEDMDLVFAAITPAGGWYWFFKKKKLELESKPVDSANSGIKTYLRLASLK